MLLQPNAYNIMVPSGLVSGFVSLPTFMTAESSEVLWALLQCDKEVA